MPLTSQELQSKLWQAADILRGQIDSADYKNYIFSILFLKRLSDRFDEEVESAVNDRGVPRETALADSDEHEFFVPEDGRWSVITSKAMGLGRGAERGQPRRRGRQHRAAGRRADRRQLERRAEAGQPGQPRGPHPPACSTTSLGWTSATPICATGRWTPGTCWAMPTST